MLQRPRGRDEQPVEEELPFEGLVRYERHVPIHQVSYYLCGELQDPQYYTELFYTLRTAADNGVLAIVVTHDLGLAARFSDIVLVMQDGRLVAQGPPAEALSEQILADVFRISAFRTGYDHQMIIVPWAGV